MIEDRLASPASNPEPDRLHRFKSGWRDGRPGVILLFGLTFGAIQGALMLALWLAIMGPTSLIADSLAVTAAWFVGSMWALWVPGAFGLRWLLGGDGRRRENGAAERRGE